MRIWFSFQRLQNQFGRFTSVSLRFRIVLEIFFLNYSRLIACQQLNNFNLITRTWQIVINSYDWLRYRYWTIKMQKSEGNLDQGGIQRLLLNILLLNFIPQANQLTLYERQGWVKCNTNCQHIYFSFEFLILMSQ